MSSDQLEQPPLQTQERQEFSALRDRNISCNPRLAETLLAMPICLHPEFLFQSASEPPAAPSD